MIKFNHTQKGCVWLMEKKDLLELKELILQLKNANEIDKLFPKKSMYQFLLECNKDNMDATAINYLGRIYTFNELKEKVDNLKKSFTLLGVKPGDRVAMGMLSTPEAIFSAYALGDLGATIFMINATHEKPSIREELKDSNADILLINDIFYDNDIKSYTDEFNVKKVIPVSLDESFPKGFIGDAIKFKMIQLLKSKGNASKSDPKCISWKNFYNQGKNSDIVAQSYYSYNNPVLISSTSGSTGKAKRPVLSHEALNSMPVQMGMSCDVFEKGDSIFTTLPIWIIYSFANSIHEPLCLGVTVDLDPIYNSKKLSKRIKQYRFNHWNSIPSYIEDMLLDKGMHGLNIDYIKSITTGGDFRTPKLKALGEKLLRENNCDTEVGQGYGLSETGGCFSYTYEKNMDPKSVGKPLVGNRYKILDTTTGEELGPNQIGELYLYSPSLMLRYDNADDLTKEAFVKDENGVVWYKTFDVAHYDEKGELFLDGRLRRIEISRDSNGVPTKVFPDKVKQVISMHPLVDQCEILMVPDEVRITRPIAYVVLKDNCELTENIINEIKNICIQQNVESYTIPTEYITIEEMPKNDNKKVDFNQLKEIYVQRQAQVQTKKICFLKSKKISI